MTSLNTISAVLSLAGSLVGAVAFVWLLGSKANRDRLIADARAAERARLALERLRASRAGGRRTHPDEDGLLHI
jgi:hypothetical protein